MKKKRGRKLKKETTHHHDDHNSEADNIKKIAAKVKKEKINYVNAAEFEAAIRVFYGTGKLTTYLGESVSKIANGLSYAPNFLNYSYREEMVGDAIVKMMTALKHKKFTLDSGYSPFSYFTTIAFHAFINRIKKEKKHHETLQEYKEKMYTDKMIEGMEQTGTRIYIDPDGGHDD
jgi:hypothetical protein